MDVHLGLPDDVAARREYSALRRSVPAETASPAAWATSGGRHAASSARGGSGRAGHLA